MPDTFPSAIPTGSADVSPAWLTAVLRAAGVLSDGAVRSVRAQPIGHGFVGEVVRFSLEYNPLAPRDQHDSSAGAPSDADAPRSVAGLGPASLVGKFPGTDSESSPRRIGLQGRMATFVRELRVYTDIAPTLSLRTPRLYYGVADAAAGRGVMLLEDLTPERAGDDTRGGSDAEILCAADHLARFHAAWWEHPRLDELDWVNRCDANAEANAASMVGVWWEPFYGRFRDVLSPAFLRAIPRLAPALATICGQLAGPPRTLLHGDFRLDNLFFGVTPTGGGVDRLGGPEAGLSVVAIDWGSPLRGRGAWDLAYLSGWSLTLDQRRRLDGQLVRRYMAGLAAHGVTGYSEEQCRADYRLAFLGTLPRVVAAGGTVSMADPPIRSLLEGLVARYSAAATDLGLADLFG